jgi:GNAT superfamily N-acetyltransferase
MAADEFDRWSARSVDGFVRQQLEAGLQPEDEARRDAVRIFAEQVPDGLATWGQYFLRVEELGTRETVGHVWLRVRPATSEVEGYVFDIELLETARGRGLGRGTMLATHDVARSLGATVMRLNVFGHNRTAIALYESLGYAVAGASMHRRLDDLPAPVEGPPVVLRDMTPAEYVGFRPNAVVDLTRLLPEGPATPGHRLWTAYDGTDPVGLAWVELQDRSDGLEAFGHELEVREDRRRGGHGRAVVAAVLRACHDLGAHTVRVSVFDAGARALYGELGFRVTAQTMVLAL